MNKVFSFLFILTSCAANAQLVEDQKRYVNSFTESIFSITEVMFHDVVNPPAAARFYSYSTMAAYNLVSEIDHNYRSLSDILPNYTSMHRRMDADKINIYFSATYAMLETARQIIPSGYSLEEKQNQLYNQYLKWGIKKSILDSSIVYSKAIAKTITSYAQTDGYLSLSTLQRYTPKEYDSTWYPTPPEYMGAVEPNWKTVNTFLLDSADQFKPLPPTYFNKAKATPFYRLMEEVFSVGNNLTEEQRSIARYWDCNPFANFYAGHVSVGIKKISPGGHWMSITGIACNKAKLNFTKTVLTHTLIAMGLHDGFVSCWDEKYRSERIRPKTAINRYLDQNWNSLLETPPFPEYTSGHSVISTISAILLTRLVGDNFKFTDNTEVVFGFSERSFNSFKQAADEASISRLYGGIHYRDAITNGQKQGEEIGNFIIKKFFKEN